MNVTIGPINTGVTPASLESTLNAGLPGDYEVDVTGSPGSTICDHAVMYDTELTFTKPWGRALPTMQVINVATPEADGFIEIRTKTQGIDYIVPVEDMPGLFRIGYTPTIKGMYDINVKIDGTDVSTDLVEGIEVTPAIEYSATTTHNISQVNEEGVREFYTIQLRDRFGNELDGAIADSSDLVVTMKGFTDDCQATPGESVSIPVDLVKREPYTDGIYTFTYWPTASGSYEISTKVLTKGGCSVHTTRRKICVTQCWPPRPTSTMTCSTILTGAMVY